MKKCFVVLALVAGLPLPSAAQAQRSYRSADFALAAGAGVSPAFSYTQLYGVGAKGAFKIGWGLRLTSFFAKQTDARTAPASLTSGKQSIAALFSEDIVNQIDTLRLERVQTNALNAVIHLQYSLSPSLELGFNIDALGFTFGRSQSGRLLAQQSDAEGRAKHNQVFGAKPTTLNLLLISDSDFGSLNSELYARYWVNQTIGIRAGASFQFVEYTTTQTLAFGNDRFRKKTLLPMLAVSYRF